MRLNLIYAQSRNGVIGRDNALPWHLPEDLAHFKQQTLGCPVVMGRRTWESLPPRFRPLPGRLNVVLTRDPNWHENGVHRFTELREALQFLKDATEVWVIGGAQVYAQALPMAQRVVVTEIDADFDGDAHAPQLGPEWQEIDRIQRVSSLGLPFSFVTYTLKEE